MADLVTGRFGQLNPWWNAVGQPTNATQTDIPARSNLEYLGINGLADTAAALASGVVTVVAVPVDPGTVISKLSVVVGATAASTPTHSFAAIYSGLNSAAPALLKQSTDGLTAAIAASARFDFTLSAAYTIQPGDAPNGYIWAAVSVTGTAVPSLATVDSGATAAQYAWFTNTLGGSSTGVAAFCATFGSAVAGTAPATITSVTKATTAPVVFLT